MIGHDEHDSNGGGSNSDGQAKQHDAGATLAAASRYSVATS